jgi:TfoX/Sxy family transcriptional regulator of competence genes
LNVQPGPRPNTVKFADGKIGSVPDDWKLLPPGDAALTRRVKTAGQHWVVQEKKGRRTFSRGVWAAAETIAKIQKELQAERSHPSHAKKQAAAKARRDREQVSYTNDFESAVRNYLRFDSRHQNLELALAKQVTQHATPVGSGTVARTKRIPIESRAEAAVIAWMRHQTTCYDDMKIPRVKGKRREVRRMLAARSKQLLDGYRQGDVLLANCPLATAIRNLPES